jgi:peptide/nickel transport system permease protein
MTELAPTGVVIEGGDADPELALRVPPVGPWRRTGRRFRRDKGAMLGLSFVVLLVLVAIFAPFVANHDPNAIFVGDTFDGPNSNTWLGTDDLGRDLFSRLVFGARVSMRTGLLIILLALAIALPLGLIAGYRSGWVDNVIMRVMDALSSIPALVLALAVVAMLGPGLDKIIFALGPVIAPGYVRLIRAQALAVREETFIEASHSLGTAERKILIQRILPNVASPLIVAVAISSGGVLIAEAGLAILGFGVLPPDASWGAMLQRGYGVIRSEPWQILIPGFVLAATVLAFNTVGDGLRDAMGLGVPKVTGLKGRLGLTTVTAPARPQPGSSAPAPLLAVEGLSVEFITDAGPVTVIEDVGFEVNKGEVLGIVGESGSGKTVSSLSIMRLIPSPPGRIIDGSVRLEGRELLTLDVEEMRHIRGREIAMVFQDPMTSINPAFTVGQQLVDVLRLHSPRKKEEARARAAELLDMVGIPDPRRRLDDYPHEMSGGMRQRALIAMALAGEPKLLIADEPTTALDVTVQAQILDLLKALQQDLDMSIIFVTHDLGVVADLCDRVAVMYAGQVVEQAGIDELFERPRHPYTEGLLSAIPQASGAEERLVSIPGVVPSPAAMPAGCRFAPRCSYADEACATAVPLEAVGGGLVRCVHTPDLELRGAS